MFYDNLTGLVRVVVISCATYAALIIALRVSGKRSLAKLNAYDLVVTVAIGSVLATVILSKDVALAEGLLALVMLLALQWIVSRLSILSRHFSDAVRSEPRVVFENHRMNEAALREERLTPGEVEGAIRSSGIGNSQDVAAVVLETDGSMSVIARAESTLDLVEKLPR